MKLETAYRKLKSKQDSLEPYLPIRLMAEVLGTGHSTAQDIIAKLVRLGKAQKIGFGRGQRSRYRIL